jgi:hypothetical protein
MNKGRDLILWVAAGVLGVALLAGLYPRAFPFLPRHWTISRDEAEAIALERLRDLGQPVRDPYVVSVLDTDPYLERRLDRLPGGAASKLRKEILTWRVVVYPPSALPEDWQYMARLSLSGEVLALRMRLDPHERARLLTPREARDKADSWLLAQGVDLARYGAPEVRSEQLAARTDLTVRYPDLEPPPGGIAHGVEVAFAGDRLAGFQPWTEDPRQREVQQSLQSLMFGGFSRLLLIMVLMLLLAFPFIKRYHEGEIGARRGGQLLLVVAGAALLLVILVARSSSQGSSTGFATREQMTWIIALAETAFQILPTALLAFFAWSVGESFCRERWGPKLAAFDSLFHGEWSNATVARSALRGVAAGCALAGGFVALLAALRQVGATPLVSLALSSSGAWPGLVLATRWLALSLPGFLTVMLCLVPMVSRRLGRVAGAVAGTLLGGVVLFPAVLVAPLRWGLASGLAFAVVPVVLFLVSDLLTVLLTGAVAQTLILAWPLLLADDSTLKVNGWLALVLLTVPLLASIAALGSRREFVYRYEDIPPHVRRIADRERQRVELETARRIQSSILPDLPPRLQGVEIAHAYLPASEVGGDFYDVLALEDGRLAVAVGDVAGHGVSSGLVMSMAKSALAVQVTFNPEVQAVFTTLNRMVHQTARKRLLATLCYLLLDPRKRELVYASAGHLFPYRVTPAGKVDALESIAYPLGVRSYLEVEPKTASLEPGDTLFLFSDGLVEAQSSRNGDLYGFERLEESLSRHANRGVEGLRDGVLADLARFTGNLPREDDQTLLALRLP